MKKILFTGGSGFIGKNIIPFLKEYYIVDSPSREELNLKDLDSLIAFSEKGNYDVIFHSANPTPVKNHLDNVTTMFEDSMKIFMNLYTLKKKDLCGKFLYIGSGAEYDKSRDLKLVKEKEIGEYIPKDSYGFAKYIMNELGKKTDNVYNLRLFGCFGPYDHESKFITHAINSSLLDKSITIRQNVWFDYIHVYDLVNIIKFFINNNPKYSDYNICSGNRITLEKIAQIVANLMKNKNGIKILLEGFNKEYTGNNERILEEIEGLKFMDINESIKLQIDWQGSNK